MDNILKLRASRDRLLKLHKSLVDFEREAYEGFHGQVTSGQFLNMLLNDPDFEWLRKYSTLIVEIDEMFDLDDGYSDSMVEALLKKIRDLIEMNFDDEYFKAKYQFALQRSPFIVGQHSELKSLLGR